MRMTRPVPFSGYFEGSTHYFACRIYYEDTDFSGIVYHANYLRYFERARSDMLRCIDIDQRAAHEAGDGTYAVADMHVKYLRPARFEDDLSIESRVTQIRGASCHIQQIAMRQHEKLCMAHVIVAFVGPEGRPLRQPKAWVRAFQAVMESDNTTSRSNSTPGIQTVSNLETTGNS